MPNYDVIALFGSRTDDGHLQPFVYELTDRAAKLITEGEAPCLYACGSHAPKHGMIEGRECDLIERHIRNHYPALLRRTRKEGDSTSLVENHLYLKLRLQEEFGDRALRIKLCTIGNLVPRNEYLFSRIFGPHYTLSIDVLPGYRDLFLDNEPRTLRIARCIFETWRGGIPIGGHDALLSNGASLWHEIRRKHRETCPRWQDGKHPD